MGQKVGTTGHDRVGLGPTPTPGRFLGAGPGSTASWDPECDSDAAVAREVVDADKSETMSNRGWLQWSARSIRSTIWFARWHPKAMNAELFLSWATRRQVTRPLSVADVMSHRQAGSASARRVLGRAQHPIAPTRDQVLRLAHG